MKKMHAIQTIVTPIDFSDNAELIVQSAAYMAGTFNAKLHIIFIVQNFEDYSGFFVAQMTTPNIEKKLLAGAEEKMQSFCDTYKEFFKKANVEIETKVLVGDVSEKIVEYSEDVSCNLIVMGTHGYKGLERIMFGSVADKVVKSARCPVTTINPYTCCS